MNLVSVKKYYNAIFYLFFLNLKYESLFVECTNVRKALNQLLLKDNIDEIFLKCQKLLVSLQTNSERTQIKDISKFFKNSLLIKELKIKIVNQKSLERENKFSDNTENDKKKLARNIKARKLTKKLIKIEQSFIIRSLNLTKISGFIKFLYAMNDKKVKSSNMDHTEFLIAMISPKNVRSTINGTFDMLNLNVTKQERSYVLSLYFFYITIEIEGYLVLNYLSNERINISYAYKSFQYMFILYSASLYRITHLYEIFSNLNFSRRNNLTMPLETLFRTFNDYIRSNNLFFAYLLNKLPFGKEMLEKTFSSIYDGLEVFKNDDKLIEFHDFIFNLQDLIRKSFDSLRVVSKSRPDTINIKNMFETFIYNTKSRFQKFLVEKDANRYNLILDHCYSSFLNRFSNFEEKYISMVTRSQDPLVLMYSFCSIYIVQADIFDIFEELIAKQILK